MRNNDKWIQDWNIETEPQYNADGAIWGSVLGIVNTGAGIGQTILQGQEGDKQRAEADKQRAEAEKQRQHEKDLAKSGANSQGIGTAGIIGISVAGLLVIGGGLYFALRT